ncbi:hypothetical protein B0I33_11237 [Prauserella shujinwangii]|uniref:SalK n=1 Tax=Prauserella shujinwangii TaxID=1453103 RepID=A0A2T0LM93_9PSEU|nr:hypothetical protein [Prauserella shujinwangii]PRX44160.1 hypothetical protein B0I33_11237 [Prauserella shujinwangii]
MDAEEARTTAYRCHRVLDPLHSLIYFAPEAEQEFTAVGLEKGRMPYFASRSAPLGAVGSGVVAATFYNFNPELVARHIPRAWTLASPDRILEARFIAAETALRRLLGDEIADSAEIRELAELTREAAEGCYPDGRPLYAAHADLDWPGEPLLVLWHAITLLREFRGDGHIAALVNHGYDGLAALVSHTATGKGFTEEAARKLRGWSEEQWSGAVAGLRERGVLDTSGALTEQGVRERELIEEETNAAATRPWERLGADKAARVQELGRKLSRTAVAAGAFPPGLFAAAR